MTKNLIILPAALLIGLALFFSCNKESQKERITEAEENSFSIEEAQSWFKPLGSTIKFRIVTGKLPKNQ
jgi:hypothetical protein